MTQPVRAGRRLIGSLTYYYKPQNRKQQTFLFTISYLSTTQNPSFPFMLEIPYLYMMMISFYPFRSTCQLQQMHNRSKLKEQQQSDRDDPSFDAQEQYDSEEPNMKDRKNKALVCKTVKQEFCLQNEDWLIRLVRLNPSKMKHILEWIHSLLELFRQTPQRYVQHINGLHFNQIHKNKANYFIYVYQVNQDYAAVKVRDTSGLIVSFRTIQKEKRASIIYEYLKKIGNKTSTYVFDHSQDSSYIKQLVQTYSTSNIIFVSKNQLDGEVKEDQGPYLVPNQPAFNFWLHKLARKVNYLEVITEYFNIQASDTYAINQILSFVYPKKSLTSETQCLLANIIKGLHPHAKKETVLTFLQKGLDVIGEHMQKWRDSEKDHFPAPSISKRALCNFCRRKKSEAICKGCTKVYDEQVHLCIRNCFQKHHELQSTFMKKQTTEICKNISFFDGLCKDISGNLNVLIEEEAEEYVSFTSYLHSKLLASMNKLLAKQNAVEEDEAETND